MNSSGQCAPFEDRRLYPRLVLHIPARVFLEKGKFVRVHLHDISPDGLQLRCDGEVAKRIDCASKDTPYQERPSTIVEFSLPVRGEDKRIIARCSICYMTGLPSETDGTVALGMQFRQFSGNSLQDIKDFFISEMEPG